MILPHEQDVTERYFFFSLKFHMVQAKINSYLNLPGYSFICMQKYICQVLTQAPENDEQYFY